MKKILLILTLACYTMIMGQPTQDTKTALLIIDVQEFYFVEGTSQLVQPEAASEKASELLQRFRDENQLVVHIRHASSKNPEIHENVKPLKSEKVITKHHVNSYSDTDLLDYLKHHGITDVIICGMMTHVCVEAAVRASTDYGFQVTVISDACTTRDLTYGEDTILAKDVHNATLATIKSFYGNVMTLKEYLNNVD